MVDRSNQRLIYFNQEWLGFVQPVGLVVAPTVLAHEQLTPDRNFAQRQRDFREFMEESGEGVAVRQRVRDLKDLFVSWLDWEDEDFVRADTHRDQLEISLPELNVVLSATWAVPSPVSSETDWLMLIRQEESDSDLDKTPEISEGWNASRHERFERLLRETKIPIGLLCNDECVRLIYAPQGESSGHITFDFSQMAQPAGRPILAAFEMLLSGYRVFVAPDARKLPALLRKSREAQAEVSTRLSQQVLAALYELLRGFVSADARSGSNELTELARRDPDTGHPVKREFGPWMWTAMKWLARLRRLRGTRLDVFGYTAERREERALIAEYEATVADLLAGLSGETLASAVEIAALAQRIRGFGHVKQRNIAAVRDEHARRMAAYREARPRPARTTPEHETL